MCDDTAGNIGAINFLGDGDKFILGMDCFDMADTLGFTEILFGDALFIFIHFRGVL